MFSATEFTYDNRYSGTYGLKIASLDSAAVEETSYVAPTITSAKPPKSKKFFFQDIKYESMPTYSFSVLAETAIPESIQRELMLWLDARKGFKVLKIHQPEFEEYEYKCIFNITETIYHAGSCVGFKLQATFDSNYQYGMPVVKRVSGSGSEQIVSLFNPSDNIDEYVYPKVEFTTVDGSISIINTTDDSEREFLFSELGANASFVVDNELKVITGSGDNLLSKFSKKWLRLVKGKNQLKIKINGTVKITCPHYVKIKF